MERMICGPSCFRRSMTREEEEETSSRTLKRERVTVLLLGVDNAGKTTLREVLAKGKAPSEPAPSFGFASSDLRLAERDVTLLDVGGGRRIRGMWPHYYAGIAASLYVMPAAAHSP